MKFYKRKKLSIYDEILTANLMIIDKINDRGGVVHIKKMHDLYRSIFKRRIDNANILNGIVVREARDKTIMEIEEDLTFRENKNDKKV